MPQEIKYTVTGDVASDRALKPASTREKDYSKLLQEYNLEYKKGGYYLKVGEISWTQGWIIDISVILLQLPELFGKIAPLLIREKLAFHIVRNEKIGRSILGGEMGYLLLGKVISIYPAGETQALEIARELISLTSSFRGPRILTDRHLGPVVYTRYGACNPVVRVNESGREEKCIYNSKGELVKDPFSIPFVLPQGVKWPFSVIAPAKAAKPETVLQDKYKPMFSLKEDTKGSVRKGLFLEKWWRIKWCVIKEGKKNMIADDEGRDIGDRLRWQFELHKKLEGVVPLPVVYDLFIENEDTYLVMEYIRGVSLEDTISNIFNDLTWRDLPLADRLRLLGFVEQVLSIVGQMHNAGFIHRDITPMNFLVDRKDRLYMIDMELSYAKDVQKPFPPFRLGTPGFMSPEQENGSKPTVEQDIYALGAMLANILTTLSPAKLVLEDKVVLEEQLLFFLDDQDLVSILCRCFDSDPAARPTLSELRTMHKKFLKKQLSMDFNLVNPHVYTRPEKQILEEVIQTALQGLASRKMMGSDHLWISKTAEDPEFVYEHQESLSIYSDFYRGLSGVLYLLSRAKKMGFSIQTCAEGVEKSREFIRKNAGQRLAEIPAGLYYGGAGIALSLVEGIENGLLPDDEVIRKEIRSYLQLESGYGMAEVAKGISGQGMALLRAHSLLGEDFVLPLLKQKLEQVINQQQRDGSWISLSENSKTQLRGTGIGHGVAGILLFLLEYIKQFKDQDSEIVQQASIKALGWLVAQAKKKKNETIWHVHDKANFFYPGLQDGCAGIGLTLIKAYELFGKPEYKQLAEECLNSFPSQGICEDLTLANGLVGYGEVCLEAGLIFNSEHWFDRANWVTQFLLHYFQQQKDGSRYWMPDGHIPTAGLMTGNGGVIHFLLRCYQPGCLGHPSLVL